MKTPSRRIVLSAISSSLLAAIAGNASAAAPLLKPTKLGQVIVFQGRKFTAIKSGKKLIWNKGVLIPNPSPKPTISASTNPSPSHSATAPAPVASISPNQGRKIGLSSDVALGQTKMMFDPSGNLKKIAVTRTATGLVAFDNTCTHQGCPVDLTSQNLLECPCHGSKFSAISGDVVNGPARSRLAQIQVIEVNGEIRI